MGVKLARSHSADRLILKFIIKRTVSEVIILEYSSVKYSGAPHSIKLHNNLRYPLSAWEYCISCIFALVACYHSLSTFPLYILQNVEKK